MMTFEDRMPKPSIKLAWGSTNEILFGDAKWQPKQLLDAITKALEERRARGDQDPCDLVFGHGWESLLAEKWPHTDEPEWKNHWHRRYGEFDTVFFRVGQIVGFVSIGSADDLPPHAIQIKRAPEEYCNLVRDIRRKRELVDHMPVSEQEALTWESAGEYVNERAGSSVPWSELVARKGCSPYQALCTLYGLHGFSLQGCDA